MLFVFPQSFVLVCFQFLKGQLLVPKGIENNSYAKLCGENKLHYEERESRKSSFSRLCFSGLVF